MLSFNAQPTQSQSIPVEHQQNVIHQMTQHQQQSSIQTMRLRENPPPITPATTRSSRKRKSPPSNNNGPDGSQSQQQQPPPPQPNPVQHVMSHPLIHAPPHLQGGPTQLPPGYPYAPDYSTGGVPPHPNQLAPQPESPSERSSQNQGRTLSSSKRAEQNRKAQRAFRERRDQHVKALESRSQLLDTALASADEANRRWEECRTLVDQLRIENAALRAALSQAQMLPHGAGTVSSNGHLDDGPKQDEVDGGVESKE